MPIISVNIDAINSDGYDVAGANVHLTVAKDVIITTPAGFYGLNMGSTGNDWLQNDGMINAGGGIVSSGAVDYILNATSGEIFGADGIDADGGYSMVLNYGLIAASGAGVNLQKDDNLLLNHGDITSDYEGIGITNAGQSTIDNYGSVYGSVYSIEDFGGSNNLTINNYGTLDGDVSLNSSDILFANHGSVIGNVTFGGGTNTYSGRLGSVTGTITGGSGADTFHLGADGETADGGGGKNVVYGGAGADTFIYSAMGAGNQTNIIGFHAPNDTIELESSVFTKLTAGATPTFATATAAINKTDYLFYNSVTGGLYYDADGSGTGKAVLLGNVGAGLHLTANNFTVV